MRRKWMLRLENLIFNLNDLQIPVYAANACYFLAISIFPALLLILASLRYTSQSAVDLIHLLEGILPGALKGAAESLIVSTYYNSSGAVLGVSAIAALWSASRGIHGLLTGLNRIYGVQENRGWLYTRLLSVGYTFVFLILVIFTLVFQVFGESLSGLYFLAEQIDWHSLWLLAVQILVIDLIYMVLPNRRNRFLGSLPGAALAAVGWQLFSRGFSLYVEHMVSRYTNIYGSVYTVAIGLLWVYWCVCILLFGGLVNRLLNTPL